MSTSGTINGFVLAGGKSRRMGRDKALMQMGGKQLALRAADVLKLFVRDVALLAPNGRYGDLGLPVIADNWPDQGPLAAICTALLVSSAEWNIFLACDLPMVTERYIETLVERVQASSADAVVPRTKGGWQPLSAAFRLRCREPFSRAIQEGQRSIIRALELIQYDEISPAEMAVAGLSEVELDNMNTPADWVRLKALAKGIS